MRALLNFFRRPPARGARLDTQAGAEARPTSGLLMVEYVAQSVSPQDAVLTARVEGTEGTELRRPLSLTPEGEQGWVALHGHLLPNGPARLKLTLTDAGSRLLAEKTLTLQVRNEGETAEMVAASLRAKGAPLIVEGLLDASLYDYADPRLTAWFDRQPEVAEAHIAGLLERGEVDPTEAAALRQFVEDGFLTMEDVVSPEHLERLVAALDDAVEQKLEGYEWGASQRLHNLHLRYPAVRELWLHPRVLRMLRLIFGERANPCQSLSYVFGSEQQHHQDTIHLTPFPAGRMCGVWTALEDVQPDSGELVVFPGSHRLPRVYMKAAGAAKVVNEDWAEFGEKVVPIWTEMLQAGRFRREVYQPKAGTVLIWHENLMHAGSPRLDREKSRRSIVGHYFADGAVVYYDSSGMPGVTHQGEAA